MSSEQAIFNLYKQLNLYYNPICRSCINYCKRNNSIISKPISIWQVGKNYKAKSLKVLFVGKTARGEDKIGNLIDNQFIDATSKADEMIKWSFPYWNYTLEIANKVFKSNNAWEDIAFTNLVKCNDSSINDNTLNEQKNYCISELKVTWKEIEILKPNKIIFYTSWDYDNYIELYRSTSKFKDYTDRKNSVKIGQKNMPWWHRIFYDEHSKISTEFLRVGHPERLNKADFTNKISEWILK